MDLYELQLRLEDIYEVTTRLNIREYVFSDAYLASQLDTGHGARDAPEKLLVHQDEDELSLSLYLDPALLHKLNDNNPLIRLRAENLHAFCTVLEGISHFVYLVWNAGFERPVTQLEMEIQAEIDKYVTSVALLAQQNNGSIPIDLCDRLFTQIRFDENLTPAQLDRYTRANLYAERYCRTLHNSLLKVGDSVMVTKEIRRFYRLLKQQKLQHIAALPAVH